MESSTGKHLQNNCNLSLTCAKYKEQDKGKWNFKHRISGWKYSICVGKEASEGRPWREDSQNTVKEKKKWDRGTEEVINLWCLWHGRLSELDLDQAGLKLHQHHETYQTLNRPGEDLDKRREKADPPLLAPIKTDSPWYVGTSLLAQMSAHILWPLGPEIRRCYGEGAGKELRKTARGQAGRARTQSDV